MNSFLVPSWPLLINPHGILIPAMTFSMGILYNPHGISVWRKVVCTVFMREEKFYVCVFREEEKLYVCVFRE
jgi:hypothetical protein